MNSLFKSISMVVVAGALVSCSDSADGIWVGKCLNCNVNTESGLQMTIKQKGDKLEGVLILQDNLYGSGRLTGYVTDSEVTICSEGDTQTFVNIVWSGRIKGDTITGTYRVEPTPSAALLGRDVQKGTFSMQRK